MNKSTTPRARMPWPAVVAAGLALIGSGFGYRLLAKQIGAALDRSLQLSAPLSSLPTRLGAWQGRDVPIDEVVRRVPGFDDDYVNRRYTNTENHRVVDLFVGYTGRPRTRLGHRPDVCYVAHGWEPVLTERMNVTTESGQSIACVLYEFRRPDFRGPKQRVLATYLINGEFCNDSNSYNRYAVRDPKLFGARPAYVARIQVSVMTSGKGHEDLALLSELMSLLSRPIVSLMPYWSP